VSEQNKTSSAWRSRTSSSWTSSLKIDPIWDPIRNDRGFQQLLTGKEQIGPNK
jgi:hypothetical protein